MFANRIVSPASRWTPVAFRWSNRATIPNATRQPHTSAPSFHSEIPIVVLHATMTKTKLSS